MPRDLGWNATRKGVTYGYPLGAFKGPVYEIRGGTTRGATYFEVFEDDGRGFVLVGSKGTLGLAKDLAEDSFARYWRMTPARDAFKRNPSLDDYVIGERAVKALAHAFSAAAQLRYEDPATFAAALTRADAALKEARAAAKRAASDKLKKQVNTYAASLRTMRGAISNPRRRATYAASGVFRHPTYFLVRGGRVIERFGQTERADAMKYAKKYAQNGQGDVLVYFGHAVWRDWKHEKDVLSGKPTVFQETRARRANPALGDYLRAGKRAAAVKVAQVAADASAAVERAHRAAAAESKRRVADEPTVEQAIKVLAKAHGVKVNPAKRRKNPRAFSQMDKNAKNNVLYYAERGHTVVTATPTGTVYNKSGTMIFAVFSDRPEMERALRALAFKKKRAALGDPNAPTPPNQWWSR